MIIVAADAEQEVERLLKAILPGTEWAGKAHAVGGYVRDQYLKTLKEDAETAKDLDIMVDSPEGGGSERLTHWLHHMLNGVTPDAVTKPHQMGASYPIWQILFRKDIIHQGETYRTEGAKIEFADSQKESYPDPKSRQRVTSPATVLEDIARRDFTVNMLLKDLTTGEIRDLTGQSKEDIKNGVLRGHPGVSLDKMFSEDALRMMRLVRFHCKYGWSIPEDVRAAVKRNAERINDISSERIGQELAKISEFGKIGASIRLMDELGLLPFILPEVKALQGAKQDETHHAEGDVYTHTLMVLDNAGPGLDRQMAALLHDIGKPQSTELVGDSIKSYGHETVGAQIAEAILRRLKFDNKVVDRITSIVKNHMRPHGLTRGDESPSALRRFVRDIGDELLDTVLDMAAADELGKLPLTQNIPDLRARIEKVRSTTTKKSVLDGRELMALGIPKGPQIGEVQKFLITLGDEYAEKDKELTKEEAAEAVKGKFLPVHREMAARVALSFGSTC